MCLTEHLLYGACTGFLCESGSAKFRRAPSPRAGLQCYTPLRRMVVSFKLKHHSFYLNLQRLVVAYLEFFTENNRAYNIYMPWIEYHGCVLCLCAFPELCGIPHAKHGPMKKRPS